MNLPIKNTSPKPSASRSQWSGPFGFMLSAAGSAVGLGNIWKFPYIAGQNGGGLFIFFYLVCIFCIALPVLLAEIKIGQSSQANAVDAFRKICPNQKWWSLGGYLGLIASVLILSYYSVIGGWIISYLLQACFYFEQFSSPELVEACFAKTQTNIYSALLYQASFLAITFAVVLGGIQKGIERLNKILLPLLLLILVLLLVHVSQLPGFKQSLQFLFNFKIHQFNSESLIEAIGHSFFTISVGVGIMITYGSYLPTSMDNRKISLVIVSMDTFVALCAGLIIFTIVFSTGGTPDQGPTLIFKNLPILFYQMPLGHALAILFFFLIIFTALTSSVSLLEVPCSYLCDLNFSRKHSLLILAVIMSFLGTLCTLSFSQNSELSPIPIHFFELFDTISSKICLPLSGLICILFYAWHLDSKPQENWIQSYFQLVYRYITPLCIFAILLLGWFY